MAEDNNVIRVPEGLCTACSATQYCAEHQPVRHQRLYPRASPLSRALREIAKGKKLSSLQVPILEDAASHIEDLEDRLRELANTVERVMHTDAEAALRVLVEAQATDDGLWFRAQTAPEAYLQQALRRLHAACEKCPDQQATVREALATARKW